MGLAEMGPLAAVTWYRERYTDKNSVLRGYEVRESETDRRQRDLLTLVVVFLLFGFCRIGSYLYASI